MLYKILICALAFNVYSTAGFQECVDVKGQLISHGHLFVPAPDNCRLCLCDNGQAKVCKVFFCSHPKDCRSFTVGSTCCEYVCLDGGGGGAAGGARLAAGAAAALALLAAVLLLYRLARRRRRREEERSMNSIGYISDSLYPPPPGAWKGPPPPRGEPPPPYDEAVALSRAETLRMSEASFHRSFPNVSGHSCLPRAPPEMLNPALCYPAPLVAPLAGDVALVTHHVVPPNMPLLSSLRLLPGPPARCGALTAQMHRTIPRPVAGEGGVALDAAFDRAHAEVRRSFHRPGDARHDTGRSMPRNLNLASDDAHSEPRLHLAELRRPRRPNLALDLELKMMGTKLQEDVKKPKEMETLLPARSLAVQKQAIQIQEDPKRPKELEPLVTARALGRLQEDAKRDAEPRAQGAEDRARPEPPEPTNTLPLTVDKPSCVCYVSGEGATELEDADDYRSECENCKSTGASKWVKEEDREWAARTQTLTRQASPPAAPPPAAASTLPVRHSRPEVCPPSNWENWFSAIPDSDTESEE